VLDKRREATNIAVMLGEGWVKATEKNTIALLINSILHAALNSVKDKAWPMAMF
jgi:hypothetical protein